MQRDFELYLWDIVTAIHNIQSFVVGLTFEQYLENRKTQLAVERSFEIIGEALKQANSYFPGRLSTVVGASNAMRFRDRLAHGYFALQQDIVWNIIHGELPTLLASVTPLLSRQDS
jgi:uncharacterized protein with HEPN domain